MRLHPRILLITFIESFATILIERGVFFYAKDVFGFGEAANLALALLFGGAYVAGALASSSLARRFGEKRLALAAIASMLVIQALLVPLASPATLLVANALMGLLNGLRWPIVESYVGAGHTPLSASAVVGRFNLAWASAVPLSIAAAGPILDYWDPGLFALGAAINAVSLILLTPLPARPVHLPHDHPERPDAGALADYQALLTASRWLMLMAYSLLWILAAVLPVVLPRDHGLDVAFSPAVTALLDVFRVTAFLLLGLWTGWHRKRWPLLLSLAVLPAGFLVARYAPSLPVLLVAEAAFGLAMGQVYYAALYYAMVVRNAAVDAGGAHEGLIGAGFFLGPVIGLAGEGLAHLRGGSGQVDLLSTVLAIAPLVLIASVAAAGKLLPARPEPAGR